MALWDRIWSMLAGEDANDAAAQAPSQRNDATASTTLLEAPEPPDPSLGIVAESTEAPWFAPQDATLLEPAEIERPELSYETRVLESLLVQQFDGHDLTLPPLPRVPEAVIKQLRDPDCRLTDVARTISEDQVAAAAVLRTVNSPLYCGVNKITSLAQAVSRLGINPLRTIMMHLSLRAAMSSCGKGSAEFARILWRRSVVSALTMKELSGFTDVDSEDAFVLGLLHDVGNVVVLRVVSNQKSFAPTPPDLETFDYLCHETHQELGELVADAWNLPSRVKGLIQNHHAYPATNDPLRTERVQLILSDMIGQMLGYGLPASYDLLQSRPAIDLSLIDREDFVEFLENLPDKIEQSIGWF